MSDDVEHERWRYEQNIRQAEKQHDDEKEFRAAANKAAVDTGVHAIKAFLLINAGASIAMLAFLGRLIALEGVKLESSIVPFSNPLMWFAWGGCAFFGRAWCWIFDELLHCRCLDR